MGSYEILEHTADVGVRAQGETLEECFEQATRGLLAIVGIDRPGPGERVSIELSSEDLGALLVDWLNEIIYLHDARDAVIADLVLTEVSGDTLRGELALAPRGEDAAEGVQVKAVTYHQLRVEHTPAGYVAEVYFDV